MQAEALRAQAVQHEAEAEALRRQLAAATAEAGEKDGRLAALAAEHEVGCRGWAGRLGSGRLGPLSTKLVLVARGRGAAGLGGAEGSDWRGL